MKGIAEGAALRAQLLRIVRRMVRSVVDAHDIVEQGLAGCIEAGTDPLVDGLCALPVMRVIERLSPAEVADYLLSGVLCADCATDGIDHSRDCGLRAGLPCQGRGRHG